MLPDRCSVKQNDRDCVNPPEYVVEIVHNDDSYMVGITCEKHKDVVTVKIGELQKIGKIPEGCLLYTSPSPRDRQKSRMPSSA